MQDTAPSTTAPQLTVDEALIRRHQAGLWRFLRFLGCPPNLADDLTQETFLVLLRQPIQDHGSAALASWLRRTAFNLFRAQQRSPRAGLQLATPEQLEQAWSETHGADGDGSDYMVALDACLKQLDGKSRQALELRHTADASRERMARELGMQPEGIKTLLRRARAKLRVCIQSRLTKGDDR